MIEEIREKLQRNLYRVPIGNMITCRSPKMVDLDYINKILDEYSQYELILEDNGKYMSPKSFEELKKELGDKYDRYMYNMNLELLKNKEDLDKIKKEITRINNIDAGKWSDTQGCKELAIEDLYEEINKLGD